MFFEVNMMKDKQDDRLSTSDAGPARNRIVSSARPTAPVAARIALGEAIAIGQREGDGDVFAVFFDKRRRVLTLAVRTDRRQDSRRPVRFVALDSGSGEVVGTHAPQHCHRLNS